MIYNSCLNTCKSVQNEEISNETKHINVKCQTIYRESEAQTDAWQPEAKLAKNINYLPEILFFECENWPNEKSMKKIERDRIHREWEENLKSIPHDIINFNERIEQMRIIELEKCLSHEKEFNEQQEDRLKCVNDNLQKRQQYFRQYANEIINKSRKINEIRKNERLNQLQISHDRKMRKLLKSYNTFKNNSKLNTLNTTYTRKFKEESAYFNYDQSRKNSKLLFDRKKDEINAEKKLRKINKIFHTRNQLKHEPGRKSKTLQHRNEHTCYNDSNQFNLNEKNYQNKLTVHKTIKRAVLRNMLINEVQSQNKLIKKYQKCSQEILPDAIFEDFKEQEEEKCEIESIDTLEYDEIQDMVTKTIQIACEFVQNVLKERASRKVNIKRYQKFNNI